MSYIKPRSWKVFLSAAVLLGGMTTGIAVATGEQEAPVNKVQINGHTVPSQTVNGTAYVSVEAVGQALGQSLSINKQKGQLTIESRLDTILKRDYIRVGTPGDYKPFSYLNPQTKEYEGYDIEAAKLLGKQLGVEVRFVPTTWPSLMKDLAADKFDIAMGGVTRTLERQKTAHFSQGYIPFGKSPLIRKEDQNKYKSLADIDQPTVTIGVNPGGTNEGFVKTHIKQANVITIQNNLDIPKAVAEGKVDVMITDNVEAIHYAKQDSRLYAALTDQTFTKNEKGYLMQRGDEIFADWIDMWVEEMKLQGEFDRLEKKWIE